MSDAKPLREFEPMDWVPIDYGEVFDKRRPFPNQKGMARALEVDFRPEKKAEDSYDHETTGEIFQKLFGDDEVDPEHIAEVKRIMGIKPEASPYARLAEVYAIGSEEEEKMAPHLSCEINGVQCKALCDIRAQVSVISPKIYDKVQGQRIGWKPTQRWKLWKPRSGTLDPHPMAAERAGVIFQIGARQDPCCSAGILQIPPPLYPHSD
jgi:hypothetical protein